MREITTVAAAENLVITLRKSGYPDSAIVELVKSKNSEIATLVDKLLMMS